MKNSDLILESKNGGTNQNKNPKQPDRPDAMWKFYFTLEIMNSTINKTFYTFYRIVALKVLENFQERCQVS